MSKSILDFVEWTFDPDNRVFLKNSSPTEISNFYQRLTGKYIKPNIVLYNRSRWLKIKDLILERKKLPISFFTQEFKRLLKENGIEIDYGYAA